MYDSNPLSVKFHLNELERQAKPWIKEKGRKTNLADYRHLGFIAVVGLVGLTIFGLTA